MPYPTKKPRLLGKVADSKAGADRAQERLECVAGPRQEHKRTCLKSLLASFRMSGGRDALKLVGERGTTGESTVLFV